jgi:hypothetical protein
MGRKRAKARTGTATPTADEDPTHRMPALPPGPPVVADPAPTSVVDPNVLSLRRVDAEIRRLMDSWVELEGQLAARDDEIEGLREHADLAEHDLRLAHEEIADARGETGRLRAELSAALDAGREDQALAERKLAEHRDALLGIAEQLRLQERSGRSHEEEKALLAARAEDADRRCAELDRALEERAAAMGAVEAQAREARESLELERAAGAELRARLQAGEQSLLQMGAVLDRQRERTETAINDASRSAQLVMEAQARIAELERDNARLLGEVAEQAGQLAAVDSEYREKCRAIAALGAEVERLADIQTNIRDLGSRISRRLGGDPVAASGPGDSSRNTRLLVVLDGAVAARYPLYKDCMVIGRGPDADIRVRGRHTSRRHARLVVEAGEVTVEDLGSLNGLTVNEHAVTRQPLRSGDVLDVGGARLRYLDLGTADAGAQAGGA